MRQGWREEGINATQGTVRDFQFPTLRSNEGPTSATAYVRSVLGFPQTMWLQRFAEVPGVKMELDLAVPAAGSSPGSAGAGGRGGGGNGCAGSSG